jgi:small subunit ribosomal protein S20
MMRTYVKHVVKAIEKGDLEAAKAAFQAAQPMIDKAANKGLIHKNTAARQKSRLSSKIKQLVSA